MNRFYLKACGRCGGDLAKDEGDWICLQCGTYYYVGLYPGNRTGPVADGRWNARLTGAGAS